MRIQEEILDGIFTHQQKWGGFCTSKKFEQAHAFLEESQSIFHAANDPKGLAFIKFTLAKLGRTNGTGDFDRKFVRLIWIY
jgi:hypothetical protein